MKPLRTIAHRAGLLLRESDTRPGDESQDALTSIAGQRERGRRRAEQVGWILADAEYVEPNTSAFKRRTITLPDGSRAMRVVRPQFHRALADLHAGVIDGLIVDDQDRLVRDPRDLEDLIDVVEQTGHPVVSVSGGLDLSTNAGVTTARLMCTMANQASRDTRRRVTNHQAEMAAAGRWRGGGRRGYGYEPNGIDVREEEAEIIRECARRILEGNTLTALAVELQARGVPTVTGAAWTATSVRKVVTKVHVAGLIERDGQIVGRAAPGRGPAAILDEVTWRRVRAMMADRALGVPSRDRHLLSGIAVCGLCGTTVKSTSSGARNHQRQYGCVKTPGSPACGHIRALAAGCEAVVEEVVIGWLAAPGRRKQLEAAERAVAQDVAGAELDERIRDAEDQLRQLAADHGGGVMSRDEWIAARAPVAKRLADFMARQAARPALVVGRAALLAAGEDAAQRWAGMSVPQRRQVLSAVTVRITVGPAVKRSGFDPGRVDVQLVGEPSSGAAGQAPPERAES